MFAINCYLRAKLDLLLIDGGRTSGDCGAGLVLRDTSLEPLTRRVTAICKSKSKLW